MKTSLSNNIDRIRKALLNIELDVARVETEIEKRKEKIYLLECISGVKAQRELLQNKVEKENYEVFLYRLLEIKKGLLRKVDLVAKKYEGDYSDIFSMYFFQKMSASDIAVTKNMKVYAVNAIIARMESDIYGLRNKKKRV